MRAIALDIVRRLQAAGHEACWVGGCVRDMLLGREPKDYDIATSAQPAQIEAVFNHTVPVGRQFGVVLVVEGGESFQVATFRTEGPYSDGRRPDRVEFSDARTDAGRRDFTVNGLVFDPVTERLFDWVGGEADLRARQVRTIGDSRARFGEDHLRLIRAVRFAAQLGFEIEPDTWQALRQMAGLVNDVAMERVRDELLLLFQASHAGRGLRLFEGAGLLEHVLPELQATVTCDQSPEYHPEGTVFTHLCLMLDSLPTGAPAALAWSVLLHDVAKPVTATREGDSGRIRFPEHERIGADMASDILKRLRFPRRDIDDVVTCVRYHMQFKDAPKMRRSTLRRMLLRPTIELELELHRLDCLGSHGRMDVYDFLVKELYQLRRQPELKPPLLTGDDLVALGVPPGPGMGALLAELREGQLQDELKTPEQAREWVSRKLSNRTD
jgi:poly(A) polymerase